MATWVNKFQVFFIACNGPGKHTTATLQQLMDVDVTSMKFFDCCFKMITLLKQPRAVSMVGSQLLNMLQVVKHFERTWVTFFWGSELFT
eukprot:9339791-Karenia_brevis.AAC.1